MHYQYWFAKAPEPIIPVNKKQLECLALNMYHEARGEGTHGMLLVGNTTINRVLSKRFPNTICKVVYQKSQFSWTKDSPSVKEKGVYKKVVELAKQLVYRDTDHSYGSVYFYNYNVVTPAWAKHKQQTVVYGNHRFLR
jgi:spore germination cell wall hydrolase CwlJ-like protein